ncbi:MAG TPA: hypothetical protein VG322_11065 [Candidatus Acidoferrales bacterium]|jgi:hypothetical protein|nr:hypothetical protein [Candidatus Acidoferrales bacterium]
MKTATVAGIVLIVLGIIGLVYQGIGYTKRKDVLEVGPIHATKDTHETVPIPPIVGGIALVGGIVLLIAGAKSTA